VAGTVIDTVTKKKTDHLYRSEEDARMRCRSSAEISRPLVSRVRKALDVYRSISRRAGTRRTPNRPRTVEVTMDRLRKLFEPAARS